MPRPLRIDPSRSVPHYRQSVFPFRRRTSMYRPDPLTGSDSALGRTRRDRYSASRPDRRRSLLLISATPRKAALGCLPNHPEAPQDRTPDVDSDADCTPATLKRPAMWEDFCSSLQSTDQTMEMTQSGNFILRSRSWKCGSSRNGSSWNDTFRYTIHELRFR